MFLQDCSTWANKLQTGATLATQFYKSHKFINNPQHIAFIGMGGSGIAGRIIQEIVSTYSKIPVSIVDSTQIPAHFNKNTLCFVISYSGNTWETLEAFDQLINQSIPVVAMAHGGLLAERAQQYSIPFVTIPSAATPRSSLGYTLGFFLQLFGEMNIFDKGLQTLKLFIQHAHNRIPQYTNKDFFQEFLEIAKTKNFFHVWGIAGYGSACAYRAQTQFNENSKLPVVHSSLPELNHNLLVGFTSPSESNFVLLMTPKNLPRSLEASISAVCEILNSRGTVLYKPTLFGDNFMVQFFDMILWADFASYHLGMTLGVDVAAVEIIDLLKKTHGQKLLS